MKRVFKVLLAVVTCCGLKPALQAQLTATVAPGYQFSPTEVPTASTLNLLGMPSITIQGTISGTVGLAAKSVSGDHLMDSVVDGVNLGFNGASPRQIILLPDSIGSNLLQRWGVTGTNIAQGTLTCTNLASGAVYPTNIFWTPVTYSGPTITISWSDSETFYKTLTAANTTISFANAVAGQQIVIAISQDANGSRTVTWPTITWRGGAAPVLTTTPFHTDIISLIYMGGGLYYGNYSLNFF